MYSIIVRIFSAVIFLGYLYMSASGSLTPSQSTPAIYAMAIGITVLNFIARYIDKKLAKNKQNGQLKE